MRNVLISFVVLGLVAGSSVAFGAPVQPSPAAKTAFERAEKALEAQKYDDAVAAYQAAINATPGYAPALNGLGSALFKQKKPAEAIAQFKAATEADASFKLAWFNLGYAARKSQDFATAAAAYHFLCGSGEGQVPR